MDQRSEFMKRLTKGERMSDLCREFQISRQTGYKLKRAYEASLEGGGGDAWRFERSRAPHSCPHKTPQAIVKRVLAHRRKYPTWGPKKLKASLTRLEPDVRWPAASTIGEMLKDAGLSKSRKRRRRATPTPMASRLESTEPNDLWCIDFKGDFVMGDGKRCYPLTVTDHFTRYLVGCEALASTQAEPAAKAMERVFEKYGLPKRIRSDNGSPFASTGLLGLTQFNVWLLRLGIQLERIQPGHPEQNGRHERMHLTLLQDVLRPPSENLLQQQQAFDRYLPLFNEERPHEALKQVPPGELYKRAKTTCPKQLVELDYALHDEVRQVSPSGVLALHGERFYISRALAGQRLGLRKLATGTWLASFLNFDLGYLDTETGRLLPLEAEDH